MYHKEWNYHYTEEFIRNTPHDKGKTQTGVVDKAVVMLLTRPFDTDGYLYFYLAVVWSNTGINVDNADRWRV